jgi:hypothetical protein
MTTDDHRPFRPDISALLGILAPLLCIALQFGLDMAMISELPPLAFLNAYPFLNYGVVVLEMLTLVIWLALGDRVGRWGGIVSGVLLAGSLFASLLGLALLPFSLIGLVVFIGVLGLVPLGTSFVFFRNGRRAFLLARNRMGYRTALVSLLLGAVLVFCVPGAIQARISRVVRIAMHSISVGAPDAAARLRGLPLFMYRDQLVGAYERERDPVRRGRLATAYAELCGEDIELQLERLRD